MSNEATINQLDALPKPAKLLTRSDSFKGMLIQFEVQGGKFTDKSVKLTLRDKDDQDYICHVGVTGGEQYQELYDLLTSNPVPFAIDIGVSDGYKGRKIQALKPTKPIK